jgi:hypothetical protein
MPAYSRVLVFTAGLLLRLLKTGVYSLEHSSTMLLVDAFTGQQAGGKLSRRLCLLLLGFASGLAAHACTYHQRLLLLALLLSACLPIDCPSASVRSNAWFV